MSDLCQHNQMSDHCSICREEDAAARLRDLRREHQSVKAVTSLSDVARQIRELDLRLASIDQELVGVKNILLKLLTR